MGDEWIGIGRAEDGDGPEAGDVGGEGVDGALGDDDLAMVALRRTESEPAGRGFPCCRTG